MALRQIGFSDQQALEMHCGRFPLETSATSNLFTYHGQCSGIMLAFSDLGKVDCTVGSYLNIHKF